VSVNVNDVCNAFFIPLPQPSINFFRAGGNCPNTAYLDIVAHEYGHAFHHWFHGWANPGAFSEGIGDHLSLYITGQRQFARNGFNNGTPWRDYRAGGGANQTLYPCINCEVHKGGEVWAGFTMDLRDNLIATRGAGVGIPLAETLTIGQYAGNPMNEVAAVAFIYLNDDNDGSLLNGTPNCADITRAALRHNLPCGAPAPAPGLAWRYRVPVFEAGLNAPGANDIQPTLENTGKLIWWSSNRAGGFGGHDVYGAQRATLANAWSPAVNIAGVNTPSDELYPCISSDLLSLWFVSNRPGGQGGQDIWVSTRANLQAPFPAAVPVAALNSPGLEEDPAISSDGLEIFFGSDRAGDRGLWTATRPNVAAPWGAPVRIAELDTPGQEHSPAISSDGIRLYFASDRAGGVGSADHYLAVRVNRGARWTIYRNLVEMNSPFWDCNADETADAFSIYFTSYTGGGATSDLYRADQVLPQLRANEVVRPGQMLTVALRRDPGNFGVLVLGWGQVPPTPIPGLFGNLEIVIGTNLAWGPLSADGLLGFSFVVPQIPYFVAQVQGFCVDGANAIYASNLASITFTP
jgi:hypothetical protein